MATNAQSRPDMGDEMRIGALIAFSATSNPKTWIVAAWHSQHSLTWRWGLYFSLSRQSRPFFSWHTQAPIYYRDLWLARERRENELFTRGELK